MNTSIYDVQQWAKKYINKLHAIFEYHNIKNHIDKMSRTFFLYTFYFIHIGDDIKIKSLQSRNARISLNVRIFDLHLDIASPDILLLLFLLYIRRVVWWMFDLITRRYVAKYHHLYHYYISGEGPFWAMIVACDFFCVCMHALVTIWNYVCDTKPLSMHLMICKEDFKIFNLQLNLDFYSFWKLFSRFW